jgi:quinol monooxygenase YgiN
MEAIRAIRNRRTEMNVPPSKKAALFVLTAKPQIFTEGEGFLQRLAYAENVSILDAEPTNLDGMLTITTADHILYGSDYPYVAEQVLVNSKESLTKRLASIGLNPQDIFTDNARRLFGENVPQRQYGEKIVRLAEIEVFPESADKYLEFAKEVGMVSTETEPGVLSLFSMQAKDDPCKIYILEIYADQEAYQSHIQTAHFKKYKEGTLKMVKSLKLIDTTPLAGMKKWME